MSNHARDVSIALDLIEIATASMRAAAAIKASLDPDFELEAAWAAAQEEWASATAWTHHERAR